MFRAMIDIANICMVNMTGAHSPVTGLDDFPADSFGDREIAKEIRRLIAVRALLPSMATRSDVSA